MTSPDVLPAVSADRAVEEALASVRAEGLEPGALALDLLARCAAGELRFDQAIEQLRQHYGV